MHILISVPSLAAEYGGPAATVSGLAKAIHNKGIKITILSDQLQYASPEVADNLNGISYKSLHTNKELSRLINGGPESEAPDLIHDNGIWLPVHHKIAKLSITRSIPRVVKTLGMLEPWSRHNHWLKKQLAWWAYQKNDIASSSLLHATSRQEGENLQLLGVHTPIAVIGNGIHLPDVKQLITKVSPLKRIRTAIYLSRIHPKKGLLNLVKAWEKVCPPDWQLIIAGPDEGGHQLVIEEEVKKTGLQNIIKFVGPLYGADKDALFQNADLFVLPTFSENFGVVVAEALGWKLPVITTQETPWSVLGMENCGWWIKTGVEPLVEALREATSISDNERSTMGERGRALIHREYSWQRIAEQMLAVYNWLLGSGPKPECVL